MKRVLKYASLLFVSTAMLVACGKKEDVTPTPETPVTGNDICLGGNTTKITIDASTDASQSSYNGKSYSCTAAAGQAVTIFIDIKSKKDLDYIFIKKVSNGGQPAEFKNLTTIKSEAGADLKGGTDFSYEIPGGDFINTPLQVKIPVDQISANSTDVYTIWFTKSATIGGAKGDFSNTKSKTVVGPIYVTLQNGSAAGLFATQSSLLLGDQANTNPSYVTTSGGVNTLAGASLIAGDATEEEKTTSLNAVDFNFVSLNAAGTAQGDYSTPYFISVGLRKNIDFSNNKEGSTLSTFQKVTLSKAFGSLTATDIAALSSPPSGATKVVVENNSDYVFVTADGRKGVIHTSELTSPSPRTVKVDVKVLAAK